MRQWTHYNMQELSNFYRFMRRYMPPLLPRERERELAEAWCYGRDRAARDALILANLRMVLWHAIRRTRKGRLIADQLQDGTIGLIRAVDGFDPAAGNKLSTYAWRAVLQEMIRGEQLMRPVIRQIRMRNRSARDEAARANPAILGRGTHVSRLQDWENLLGPAPEEQPDLQDDLCQVRDWLQTVSPREREVIEERYGIDRDHEGRTLEEIGQSMGITKERVRQIQAKGEGCMARLAKVS